MYKIELLFYYISQLKVDFVRRVGGSLVDYVFKTSIRYWSSLYEPKTIRILYSNVSGWMNAFYGRVKRAFEYWVRCPKECIDIMLKVKESWQKISS